MDRHIGHCRGLLLASLALSSLGLVFLAATPPEQESPYAGLGGRPIKAIGPEEAADLERAINGGDVTGAARGVDTWDATILPPGADLVRVVTRSRGCG